MQWLALQTLHDRHARLVEGGAEADAQKIDLASIFIDLPVHAPRSSHRSSSEPNMAMPHLLGMTPWFDLRISKQRSRSDVSPRMLLLGGPGSGKSTLTTIVAQVLRLGWVNRQIEVLPPHLLDEWQSASVALEELVESSKWLCPGEPLPMRINLPLVARWLATGSKNTPKSLSEYLAGKIKDQLADEGLSCELSPEEVQGWLDALPHIYWILDGLDEVPMSAGRKDVIDLIRAGTGIASRVGDSLLVATRPQGYAREFAELDEIELRALPPDMAREYAEKVVQLWSVKLRPSQVKERLQTLREELQKPTVETLLHTPLHTTMAALLVANQGKLPSSRSELFEDYFQTILRRELNKPIDFGIRREDKSVLRALHTHAGLTLQVRSQQGAGARSTLRRRELREILSAWYRRQGHQSETTIQANVERIMRFAVDRLVLLLHWSEGEFEFGVRSLQEFFAAEALTEEDGPVVEKRLADIATNPHWSNVLRLMASHCSRETDKRSIELGCALVATCRAMNDGALGGDAAKRCFAGSELALAFLEETEEYGQPVFHDPLWGIALEGACSSAMELGKLAAKWSGANGDAHRNAVLRIVEAQFEAGGEAKFDGWELLYGMLCTNQADAVALADRYEPTTRKEAERVANALVEHEIHIPQWLTRFVDQHSEWFVPESLWDWTEGEERPLVAEYPQLLRTHRAIEPVVGLDLSDGPITWIFRLVVAAPKWTDIAHRLTNAPASWLPWHRLAVFLSDPSHVALANLLETIDSVAVYERFADLQSELPWPLVTCLYHAKGPAELVALGRHARAGDLGTVDDWRAAELRWRTSRNVSLDDLENALIGPLPWNKDIAISGAVVACPSIWHSTTADNLDAFATRLLRLRSSHPEAFFRAIPIIAFHNDLRSNEEVLVELIQSHEPNPPPMRDLWYLRSPLTLAPDLKGRYAEQWFAFLDAIGQKGKTVQVYSGKYPDNVRSRAEININLLMVRVRRHPEQWGLLDTFFALVCALPDTDLSTLQLPPLETSAPPRAHALHALFGLLQGGHERAARAALLAKLIFEENGKTVDFHYKLADVLNNRTIAPSITEAILLEALTATPEPTSDIRESLCWALWNHLHRSTPSAFLSSESWKNHVLPEPCLSETCPVAPAVRLVRITELRNVRLFKETPVFHDSFPTPTDDQGQWIILLGENGVGKTTLLRAIALTLTSPGIATELLDKRLPILSNGTEGAVSIDLDSGTYAITIRYDETDRKPVVESRLQQHPPRPWIVGYGVRRGNARGERDREAEVGPIGELHTLFDHPPSLHNAIRWLADLDADVLREQRKSGHENEAPTTQRAGIWKAVGHALHALLGIKNISVDVDRIVYVQHDVFGRVRLDALSDGYLTTAGWVIDMIARWVDRQREIDEHVGVDILRQMRGLVLLDEIDLHLHPVWQMKIIDDVRRLFPNLSFVVTTHNPLTLQGARPGEVFIMRRQTDGRIEFVQKDIQPGHDVDRVLFEQFAVEQTFDKDTRDLLKCHKEMLIRGARPDDPDRMKVEAQISARFGAVGDTLTKERDKKLAPMRPLSDDERAKMLDALQSLDNEDT